MTTKHLCISIEWLEDRISEMSPTEANEYCLGMFNMRIPEFTEALAQMKSEWMAYVPSEWCPTAKPDGKCKCS